MTALERRLASSLATAVDPAVAALAAHLAGMDQALGVLFYGSNLRTGSREGVLDFYVLLPGPQRELIWPRVSYHEWEFEGELLRAKVATLSLETFASAARGERFDTTIWARFVQPSVLAWQRDAQAERAITSALAEAAQTAARLAVALGPPQGDANEFWRALFRATYAAEFRIEPSGREDSILAVNADHFEGLLPLALEAQGIAFARTDAVIAPHLPSASREQLLRWWNRCRRMGKALNIMRLIKASTTFEGAARYAAWKIERHTGVKVKLTPWRERHPVMAAPLVLFGVWRARR